MKVGFLAERLLRGFGVDLVIHNQANGLVERGYEVTVYVQRYEPDAFKDKKYEVIIIDSPLRFNPLKTELALLKSQRRFLRNEDNDAWIIHSWPFNVLTPFLKGKVFIVDHGTVSTEGMYLKQKLVFWYQKYFNQFFYFPFSTKIISISKYIKSGLPFFLRWKSIVNYNGADHYTKNYIIDNNRIASLKNQLGIGESDVVALYVGRLNHGAQPYKGVEDLRNIYKEIKSQNPNIKLIMAGFGSDEDVKDLSTDGIIALNNVPDEQLLDLYEISDFYVSATKWEGFNLPMIEAQSFGKIPIIYNIGPHSEITNSGSDSFVVQTYTDFIEKAVALSKDKDRRTSSASIAKMNASKYTWNVSVDNLDKILKKYTK